MFSGFHFMIVRFNHIFCRLLSRFTSASFRNQNLGSDKFQNQSIIFSSSIKIDRLLYLA